MKSTDILFAQERDDSMLGELKAKVLQDAEDYYQRLVRFTEQGDYEAASDSMTGENNLADSSRDVPSRSSLSVSSSEKTSARTEGSSMS